MPFCPNSDPPNQCDNDHKSGIPELYSRPINRNKSKMSYQFLLHWMLLRINSLSCQINYKRKTALNKVVYIILSVIIKEPLVIHGRKGAQLIQFQII